MGNGRKRKKSAGKKVPKAPVRLSLMDKRDAMEAAEEMLMRRVTERAIAHALMVKYDISLRTGQRIVSEAIKEMVWAVNKAATHRRAQQIASLDRLHERCLDAGKFQAAIATQKLLARIEGNEKPKKHEHRGLPAPPVREAAEMDEFDDTSRSIADLDHYAEHGHWPEEGSEIVEAPVDEAEEAEFPLH